tara:strand:- start:38 stop:256 length:219 start_codon:yes stop_codon:yes gene_type:complete
MTCGTHLTQDEYELIEEALTHYSSTLNDGRGLTLINRQAGRLLAKLDPANRELVSIGSPTPEEFDAAYPEGV